MNQRDVVASHIVLSLAAAGMLVLVSWLSSPQGRELTSADQLIVAVAFMAGCVFGLVQSTIPNRVVGRRKGEPKFSPDPGGEHKRRVGHHPDCGRFNDHIVVFGSSSYCSGCLGLALGSGISLLFMAAYPFFTTPSPGSGVLLVLAGLGLVALDLFETAFRSRRRAMHVLVNILLVIGFLLVTIGVSEATGSVAYGLLAILVSFLWADTRIQISDLTHAEICRDCGQGCRPY